MRSKKRHSKQMSWVVLVCVFCSGAFGQPWDGNGVEGDAYQVWTAADMQAIGADHRYWNAQYLLMADIDLGAYTGTSFNIIGRRLLSTPFGIALDTTAGRMYWTDYGAGKIQRANLDGAGLEDLVTDADDPTGIALDIAGGKMYWADLGTDKIQRANLDGSGAEDLVTTGLSSTSGIALDIAAGKMYWTDAGTEKIQRANLDGTGAEDLITTGLMWPFGIALDIMDGKMYWADGGYGKIQRANLDGTGVEDLVTGLASPRGIAVDIAAGKMYWADPDADKIQRANLDGTEVEDLVTTGLNYPIGIALDVAGGKMYWTDLHADKIRASNLDGTFIFDVLSNGFTGVFNGSGHTISNFTYNSYGIDNIGLFGYINDPNAEVKDLGLIDPTINAEGDWTIGSLAGWLEQGIISGCHIKGGSITGGYGVGGLVGYNNNGDISGCYVEVGSVTGEYRIGGLAGVNWAGDISSCYSRGVVSGRSDVGGLIGSNGSEVANSYSSCSVTGESYVGGLVGENFGNSYVQRCYSTGSVSGTNGGGLVGYSTRAAVGSYWDIETSGVDSSGTGTGLTTAEMQSVHTFLAGGWGGCGNGGEWTIDDGNDYPRLSWEEEAGVVISGELSDYLEGVGTAGEPYLIYNASELNLLGVFPCEWSGHFKLMADIDLGAYTGTSFNIIGMDVRHPFSGVFDGNGHVISNFTYDSNGINCIGLLGYIDDPDAEVKDLGLTDANVSAGTGSYVGALVGYSSQGSISGCYVEWGRVTGGDYVGALVGRSHQGSVTRCHIEGGGVTGEEKVGGLVGCNWGDIQGCYSTGSVTGSGFYVGGLVGDNYSGTISRSHSEGNVSGNTRVGGLVGDSYKGTISECYSRSIVSGGWYVGGLVGSGGYFLNCYSTGSVSGDYDVGGLVGLVGDIINCYASGSVEGNYYVGGLVGNNSMGSVSNSFWDVNSSGEPNSDGGTGKTTAEMQTESTFTDAGWDFVGEVINGANDIWYCDEPNYPQLAWEVALSVSIDMDKFWMYQSLPGQSNSDLTAGVSVTDDPLANSSYSYAWEILLPGDVTLAPVTVGGGGAGDAYWTFAARGCDEPGGLSDSGQTFTVRVTVTGDDYGNTGVAEAEFGIALLGDVNNDGVVNVADRSITNAFWRTGSAGAYTLRDCDVNCDGVVNMADRSIANGIWRGILGQNSVSTPCPLR